MIGNVPVCRVHFAESQIADSHFAKYFEKLIKHI